MEWAIGYCQESLPAAQEIFGFGSSRSYNNLSGFTGRLTRLDDDDLSLPPQAGVPSGRQPGFVFYVVLECGRACFTSAVAW